MWHSMLPREGKISIEVRPGISPRTFIGGPPLKEVGRCAGDCPKLPWTWETSIDRRHRVASKRRVRFAYDDDDDDDDDDDY